MVVYQLVIVLLANGGKYAALAAWDAAWYRDIAAYGYNVTIPLPVTSGGGSNIAFFPAFPLWVRTVMTVFHLTPNIAVTFAAQLAAVGFWIYFVLLLRRLGVRPWLTLLAALAFFVQPGAFYDVVGYSESLFSFALMGFLYWTIRFFESQSHSKWPFIFGFLAILHGGALSATRIVGVPVVVFPILFAVLNLWSGKKIAGVSLPRSILISLGSLWGFFGFLLFCHLKYGIWDLYWQANRVGWHVYLSSDEITSVEYWKHFLEGNIAEVLGRLLTLVTVAVMIPMIRRAYLRRREEDALVPSLAVIAAGILFESIVGSHGMHSMIRYLLPISAIMIPLWMLDFQEKLEMNQGPSAAVSRRNVIFAAAGALLLFTFQFLFAIRFASGSWVS